MARVLEKQDWSIKNDEMSHWLGHEVNFLNFYKKTRIRALFKRKFVFKNKICLKNISLTFLKPKILCKFVR